MNDKQKNYIDISDEDIQVLCLLYSSNELMSIISFNVNKIHTMRRNPETKESDILLLQNETRTINGVLNSVTRGRL